MNEEQKAADTLLETWQQLCEDDTHAEAAHDAWCAYTDYLDEHPTVTTPTLWRV